MTYASDLGLTVGSKIVTLEGSDFYGDGEVLTLVEDDDSTWPLFTSEIDVEPHPFILIRKWGHYKEPIKVTPKLVWKEMTLEEVKAVQVGDKIRIDGVEDEVIFTFNKVEDFGFRTKGKRKHYDYDNDTDIVCCDAVAGMEYKFEKIVEETEMNNRLERTKEYDVKLTGEEIAHIYLLTGYAHGMHNLYDKCSMLLGVSGGVIGVKLPSVDLPATVGYEDAMSKLLQTPETEDQRKLRELKEKHAELGKAIEAMEKK